MGVGIACEGRPVAQCARSSESGDSLFAKIFVSSNLWALPEMSIAGDADTTRALDEAPPYSPDREVRKRGFRVRFLADTRNGI